MRYMRFPPPPGITGRIARIKYEFREFKYEGIYSKAFRGMPWQFVEGNGRHVLAIRREHGAMLYCATRCTCGDFGINGDFGLAVSRFMKHSEAAAFADKIEFQMTHPELVESGREFLSRQRERRERGEIDDDGLPTDGDI